MTQWQIKFQRNTNRTCFNLLLSRTMIEYLCAVAGDVYWDRHFYNTDRQHFPDNWIATERALLERGLIDEKPTVKAYRSAEKKHKKQGKYDYYDGWHIKWDEACGGSYHQKYCLTPAGAALVELFKVAGMFVEQKIGKLKQKHS